MFHNTTILNAFDAFDTACTTITPREWEGSPDSDCPAGKVSFWTREAIKISGTREAFFETDAEPTGVGEMRYSAMSRDMEPNVPMVLEELWTIHPCPLKRIFVTEDVKLKEFDLTGIEEGCIFPREESGEQRALTAELPISETGGEGMVFIITTCMEGYVNKHELLSLAERWKNFISHVEVGSYPEEYSYIQSGG